MPSSASNRWTAASINFLTQDEMRCLLAYRHGLRASEVGNLAMADLDLKQYL